MWVAAADVPVDREVTGKGDSRRRGMDFTSSCLDFGRDMGFLPESQHEPTTCRGRAAPGRGCRSRPGRAGRVKLPPPATSASGPGRLPPPMETAGAVQDHS